jgi:hypothetical protein
MKKFLYILGFFTLNARAFDAEKVTHGYVNLEKGQTYLFDRANHYKHAVKIENQQKLLPNRVYLRYDTDLHMWIYFKTSFKAKIPEPFEALRPDTVTSGSVVGAELRLQRFILTEDGTWDTTNRPEEYHVWVKSNPPQLKVFRYIPDPGAVERNITEGKHSKP